MKKLTRLSELTFEIIPESYQTKITGGLGACSRREGTVQTCEPSCDERTNILEDDSEGCWTSISSTVSYCM